MPRRWTEDALKTAVKTSTNMSEVCRKLGIKPGGNFPTIYSYVEKLGLDVTHFKKGFPTNPRPQEKDLSEVLANNVSFANSGALKKKLLTSGLLNSRCYICGLVDWLERPISLHLDHINGDRRDNQLANLRLLCPNCDSQTPTHKNKKRAVS